MDPEEQTSEGADFQEVAATPEHMEISEEQPDEALEASTSDPTPKDDPLAGSYLWVIPNWLQRSSTEPKFYSEKFEIGTYLWRMLVFPRGNKQACLSVYLDAPEAPYTPLHMSPKASFKLVLINHADPTKHFHKDTNHTFTPSETDWGFTSFLPLDDLNDPAKGFIGPDGSITLRAEITVQKDERYAYDSRKETGFVGLKNQGATCYMNSLLQYLYNLPYFRQAVYHMPTEEMDDPSKSIPLALQSLFYKQQYSATSVSTKDLTKSFGWGTYDAFMQHDVQELNRVLCEKLEEKMKGTRVEKMINHLFEGHTCNFLECVNVDYKSTRKESFMDLQLDVKGCQNIYDSFDKYCETEMLDGQNQYKAEGHGLQDAKKGVLFESFPPVLQLQLKRFEYDFQRDTMVKINDRYEFQDEIDLGREGGKYLVAGADRSADNRFKLHSVLVHSGGVHGGHYYAFIRPDGNIWLKFDDDRVTVEDGNKAMNEQFGGDDESALPPTPTTYNSGAGYNATTPVNPPMKFTKFSNAYMLVYIRLADWDRIMCPVTKDDIDIHLRQRLDHEQLEKEARQKAKTEAHLYCTLKIAQDQDLIDQIGKTRQFDLVDHDKLPDKSVFRLKKQTKFSDVKAMVAERMGVPVEQQRYWVWAKRQNSTMRPSRPLTGDEEQRMLMDLREFRETTLPAKKDALMDVKLFLETPFPSRNTTLHQTLPSEILLFLKSYDPVKEELKYIGRGYFAKNTKVNEMMPLLLSLAGFDQSQASTALVYEEVKFEPNVMCEPLQRRGTLASAQLEDGDILCVQCVPPAEDEEDLPVRHPTVNLYFEYIRNRRIVNLRKLEDPKEAGTTLEMGKEMDYDEVTEAIATHLKVEDPGRLRLTQHNVYSHTPQRTSIKFRGLAKLEIMMQHANQTNDILYYEVLDIPLQELEQLKTLKVSFHGERTEFVCEHSIRLPKVSSVGDVLEELRKLLGAEKYAGKTLRLMEVYNSRVWKVYDLDTMVDSINDLYWNLRAEVIPEDELVEDPHSIIISVYHFHPDKEAPASPGGQPVVLPAQQQSLTTNFGDPFYLRIRSDEPLQEIKARIKAKLAISDEEFAKWRFAYMSVRYPPLFLENDDEVVASHFNLASNTQSSEQSYLGIQHEDKAPKRAQQSYRYTYERPVKIYN